MKKIIYLCFFLFSMNFSFSQIWKNSVRFEPSQSEVKESKASVSVRAFITDGWHVFSKIHDPSKSDGIGLPLEMSLKGKGFRTQGTFTETPNAMPHTDEFGISQVLEGSAVFSQTLFLTDATAEGTILLDGQVCSDTEGCYPFKVEFPFHLKK